MRILGSSGSGPGRWIPGWLRPRWLVAFAWVLCVATRAHAVEFLDGRLQVHGFAELQVRAVSEKFSEKADIAQWQHVLGLDIEADLAPQGWGWFDRLSATLRVEGQYDAIYSPGIRLFGGTSAYGKHAGRLPRHLRDARNANYAGSEAAVDRFGQHSVLRHPDRSPTRIGPDCSAPPADAFSESPCVPGSRQGYPGSDWLFTQRGADAVAGEVSTGIVGARLNPVTRQQSEALRAGVSPRSSDDPARLAMREMLGFSFALQEVPGAAGGERSTRVLGPWLPGQEVRSLALHFDVPNPLRGRVAPTALSGALWEGSQGGASPRLDTEAGGIRYYRGDPALERLPTGFTPARIDPRDPFIAFVQQAGSEILNDFPEVFGPLFRDSVPASFGGDFSGVMPCMAPRGTQADAVRSGASPASASAGCVPGAHRAGQLPGSFQEPLLVRIAGGQGETPFRPAPDRASLERFSGAPQGLYLPSRGLQQTLARGELDSLPFNISERDRAWNRGASQQQSKEMREAYLDAELLDGSLWLRLGFQNIVWGKTEIFRTVDSWNPQDLALSSLPSLEDSRIAVWAARAVYSFYDVGPLADLRVEFALNLGRFQPADVGACGEPYAADSVCVLTHGLLAHAMLGAGIAGIDRPESPWRDVRGFELGGRIQWRWRGLGFALSDFYGYSDLPYADPIFFFERSVDVETGRPLAARLPGEPTGRCRFAGEIAPDQRHGNGPAHPEQPNDLRYDSSFASHPLSVTPGGVLVERARAGASGPAVESVFPGAFRGGVGLDADCLRPGGAPGEANAFHFDPEFLARTNALYNHHANQQIFAWSCLGTLGIVSRLDPGACGWTFFGSGALLDPVLPIPFAEAISTILAGDQSGVFSQVFLQLSSLGDPDELGKPFPAVPLAATNRLFNDPRPGQSLPVDLDGNGVAGDNSGCDTPGGACDLGGFDGFRSLHSQFLLDFDPLSLDSTLTNEQRALLGCGPFWGSRCDTSNRVRPDGPRAGTIAGSGGAFAGANENGDAIYGAFGGIDLLNAEASALMESWPGREGTQPGYFVTDRLPAPGTLGAIDPVSGIAPGFDGGPVCSRPGSAVLPGCRGLDHFRVLVDAGGNPLQIEVAFDVGYRPSVDGCVIGDHVLRTGGASLPVHALGASQGLLAELALCNRARSQRPVPARLASGGWNPNCEGFQVGDEGHRLCNALSLPLSSAPLIHPLAGCIDSPIHASSERGLLASCEGWMQRDLVEELLAGSAQIFHSEMAAVSWNLLLYLAVTSCDASSPDLAGFDRSGQGENPSRADDPECFAPQLAYERDRCSFTTPHFCKNVKQVFRVAGPTSRTVRAAGNGRFGRHTFIWHSGGEAVLRYAKRNVFGFAVDFAEDWTKSSWGVEFSWIGRVPYSNSLSLTGLSLSDELNLAISVDRPTFIPFLNPRWPFSFNTQWFFRYLTDYRKGYHANGPVDVLFTFRVSSSFAQGRLTPKLTTLYDFRSRSGGLMPSLRFDLSQSLSLTVGIAYFFGRTQLRELPIRDIQPTTSQAGRYAYRVGVENGVSEIRRRDEFFLGLRWAF